MPVAVRPCWSPLLGPMLEETVGSLFAATPLKNLDDAHEKSAAGYAV